MRDTTDRRISIVVPCYNRAAYLQLFLRSLTWSVLPPSDFEVIVVNDGGTDHVDLVVQAWRRRGLDVRVLHLQPHRAARNNAVARNTGLMAARYPIVIQTDPDIVWASDIMRAVREELAPGTFTACSGYYPLTRDATMVLAFGPGGATNDPDAYLRHAAGRPNQVNSPDGVGGLHGAFGCFRDDLLSVGGYDQTFRYWGWEDREILVTLSGDLGLVRRRLTQAPVVHLWHPLQRGDDARRAADRAGRLSQAGWDIQMQRAAAEYPRSSRPRPSSHHAEAGQGDFTLSAYDAWLPEGGAEAPSLAASGGTNSPLAYQLFFDAQRLEAERLRAEGQCGLAAALLRCTLRRPWERERRPDQWRVMAEPLRADDLAAAPLARYQHVAEAIASLALCERALGNPQYCAAALDALPAWKDGAAIAGAVQARLVLAATEPWTATTATTAMTAAPEAAALRGHAWEASRAELAIELSLTAGRITDAAAIVDATADERTPRDYFQQLRLAAYAACLDQLAPGFHQAHGARDPLELETSEFLYSAAMRSFRDHLDIAGVQLLSRFLTSGAPAEPRLHAEGPAHLEAALDRIRGRLSGKAGSRALSAWLETFRTHAATT